MLKLKKTIWLVCVLLTFSVAISQAATIYMVSSTQDVLIGDQVVTEIYMDFTDDPTLGGGIDILYDSILLSFVSFVFDPELGDDPSFRHEPDVLPDQLDGLAFGNFGGLRGPGLIGTLTFTSIGSGQVDISISENDTNWGGFYSAVSYAHQNVVFTGATVNITCDSGTDTDSDGITDCVDICPVVANPDQTDADGDGVGNVCDNCIDHYNPHQVDTDEDGIGDICDAQLGDINGSKIIDIDDVFCLFQYIMGRSSCLDNVDVPSAAYCDVNNSGNVDIDDVFCLFKNVMGRPSCMNGA